MKLELIPMFGADWQLRHPSCVDQQAEEYWQAMEAIHHIPNVAERKLRGIIKVCKDDHIDAILHLGFLYNDMGLPLEGNALIYKAHLIALEAIPKEFDQHHHNIAWGILENRPLLRTFHGIGLELMKDQNYRAAAKKFDFVLEVNPYDNQGLRYLLLECLFHLKKPEAILALLEKYPDEYSIEFLYGKALVNFQLGSTEKATTELTAACQEFPFGGKEMLKKRHPRPKSEAPYGYGAARGSKYEAYDFWQRNKQFWMETAGAMEFALTVIKKQ